MQKKGENQGELKKAMGRKEQKDAEQNEQLEFLLLS